MSKQYKMTISGMAGRIKKTEIVEIIRIEYGMAEVRKPGTQVTDYIMTGDLESVEASGIQLNLGEVAR